MTMRDDFRQAASTIAESCEELATYLPVVGDPVDIYVILFEQMELQPRSMEIQITGQEGPTIQYVKTDLEEYPKRGAIFQYSGWDTDYEVQSVDNDDGYFVTLVIKEVPI